MSRLSGCRPLLVLLLLTSSLLLSARPAHTQPQDTEGWWLPISEKAHGEKGYGEESYGEKDYEEKARREKTRGTKPRSGPPSRGEKAHGERSSRERKRGETARRPSERAPAQDRGKRPRRLHIPKGHLPPPGACRLWMPGRPPGQQPPPTSCERALREQQPPAVVVTHDGRRYSASRRASPPRWHRRPAGDIVFRRSPEDGEGPTISVEILIDLLGERGYERLQAQRDRLQVQGELVGRWVSDPSGQQVLQVRAGQHPLAELADRDGDNRVDVMFVREADTN